MGRQCCIGCERPASVCLCPQLPSSPLQTRTCVVVLQHPHEACHKLSTLPILGKCLANCHVLQGRRFQAGCSPLLDFFFTQNPPAHHVLLLFPILSAQPISAWFAHHQLQDSCSCLSSIQVSSSYPAPQLMKECKPTSEDFDASCSQCQTVEEDTSDGYTEDFEALSLQMGTSSYVTYDPDSLPQQVGALSHLHGHPELPTYPVGGTSTHLSCDSFSHSQQAANYVAQGLESQFKKMTPSEDVSWVRKYAAFDSDPCASPFINESHASSFSFHERGTSICSVKDTNSCSFPDLVLIAVDATWKHANEMIKASAPYLNKFAIPVCLPFDTDQEGFGMANSEFIIRKEPFKGCMTTLEAISSCLKVLEPNGEEIHDKLTGVLRSMVHFQASNIASHKVRKHQQKKSINRAFNPAPLHEKSHCVEEHRDLK